MERILYFITIGVAAIVTIILINNSSMIDEVKIEGLTAEEIKVELEKSEQRNKEILGEIEKLERKLVVLDDAKVVEVEKDSKFPFKYKVKTGDNLYTIASKTYKKAYLWVVIYSVNSEKIMHPDLIFAGQKFDIAEVKNEIKMINEAIDKLIAINYIPRSIIEEE
jgi:hypothetical protein